MNLGWRETAKVEGLAPGEDVFVDVRIEGYDSEHRSLFSEALMLQMSGSEAQAMSGVIGDRESDPDALREALLWWAMGEVFDLEDDEVDAKADAEALP